MANGKFRISADLDADFHRELQIFAVMHNMKIMEIVRIALREYMDKVNESEKNK